MIFRLTRSPALEAANYELVLSEDNVQEWASCWKSGKALAAERGRQLIAYALDSGPKRFPAPMSELLARGNPRFEYSKDQAEYVMHFSIATCSLSGWPRPCAMV